MSAEPVVAMAPWFALRAGRIGGDDPQTSDVPFVVSTILECNRTSPAARDIGSVEYRAVWRRLLGRLLARKELVLRVVHPADDADTIAGFSLHEGEPWSVLHYLYVRASFQGKGLARALRGGGPGGLPGHTVFTHRPRSWPEPAMYRNWRYVPLPIYLLENDHAE